MATEATSKGRGGTPYRLNVRQFVGMVRQGVFPLGVRVELLRGILVEHLERSPQHDSSVRSLGDGLRKFLPPPWSVSEGKSLELGRTSHVVPDIALIRGPSSLHRSRDPRPDAIGLLIEVADSTYAYDRGVKWRAYASAMIPIYWLVNLPKRQVEVYRDPHGRGKAASYRETTVFGRESEVPILFEGEEIGQIAVGEFIP